ncbi:MAG: hypothetical protein OEV79_08220 [candidate division WOR-3 bacterium]|nr:hypothetical protein [candidate division WOR-3 bacterium]
MKKQRKKRNDLPEVPAKNDREKRHTSQEEKICMLQMRHGTIRPVKTKEVDPIMDIHIT